MAPVGSPNFNFFISITFKTFINKNLKIYILMVYISIGVACSVKYQIDKHKHKIETLFFDRLITSMKSVIEILSCDDINKILYFDNIIRDANNNSRVIIKSLDHCVSIHDLKINFTNNDILEFIDKYKRRFNRIIKYIKSDEKIYFIRTGSVYNYTQQKFIKTILKINPNCNFSLIIIDNNKNNINNILKSVHCLYIKLNIDIPKPLDWTQTYLNWNKIFLDIENNI